MRQHPFIKWLAAVTIVASTVVAAPLSAQAVSFGEPLIDCTRDGDEYAFYFAPEDATVTAWVTDASGAIVGQADTRFFGGYWEVWVPAGTQYATVWISDGTEQLSVPAESPDCEGVKVSFQTEDYGPGLTPISPRRLYDTRTSKDRLVAGGTIEVQATGTAGIPADATAAMVNVTAVNPAAAGYLTLYPCGETRPTTAGLTYLGGETRGGASLVELGPAGKVCVYSPVASDVVVDVQGYVAESKNPVAITPTRVLDTRTDNAPIDGERSVNLVDTGALDLPFDPGEFGENIAGVWLNVTAVGAEAPGHLSVYQSYGAGNATTSRLNYEVDRAQTNLVFSAVTNGTIRIVTSSKTHVVLDVVAVTQHPNAMVPISDFRLLDTRRGPNNKTTDGRLQGTGRLQPNVERHILVGGRLGSVYPTSVLLNVAVIDPDAATHVTVYPCGSTPPTSASANAAQGKVVPNAVLVPIGDLNSVCIVSPVGTDVVIDLEAAMTTKPIGAYYATCLTANPSDGNTILGGTPPYTVTGTLPDGMSVEYWEGGFRVEQPVDTKYVVDTQLLVTDARGKTIPVNVYRNWFIVSIPPPPC